MAAADFCLVTFAHCPYSVARQLAMSASLRVTDLCKLWTYAAVLFSTACSQLRSGPQWGHV
jgi:hypothetical protein